MSNKYNDIVLKYNLLKKDIVVKNSICRETYMDYDSGRLFFECSWLNELPCEVYNMVYQHLYKSYTLKIPRIIKMKKLNGRIKRKKSVMCETLLEEKREIQGSLTLNANGFYNYNMRCMCKTLKGDNCASEFCGPQVRGMTRTMTGLDTNIAQLYIDRLASNRNQGEETLKICKRHKLQGKTDKFLKFFSDNGYVLRNGYVCKK